jgi:hypothetical protein
MGVFLCRGQQSASLAFAARFYWIRLPLRDRDRALRLFDQFVGLSISACTGNAVRIKLREAIDLAACKLPETKPVAIKPSILGASGRVPRKPLPTSFQKYRSRKDWVNGILELQLTGVDPTGDFQASVLANATDTLHPAKNLEREP